MVTQCFDSLNIYGKEPEQLENMILMMVHALAEYEYLEIKNAFIEWVKTRGEMPTPSGIIEIIHANRPKREQKYDHATPEEYAEAAERRRNPRRVPWFGKMLKDFTPKDRELLDAHLAGLGPEKADNYRKFLKEFAHERKPNEQA